MATSNSTLEVGARCSDASIAVARIVYGDTTDTTNQRMVVLAATSGSTKPLGVTTTLTSAVDKNVTVQMGGIAEIEVNGTSAIDINDSIIPSTAGVGVIAGAASATAQWAIGFALAPSAASGDVIPVLIAPHLIVKGTS